MRQAVKRHRKPAKSRDKLSAETSGDRDTQLSIIGGRFRGRRLRYHGDPVVRPMKHRTREAIFNLVTTDVAARHAIDLFAGTGALGLEALSRGAPSATFIERHVPTARVVEENIRVLGVEDRSTLLVTSAFLWAKRDLCGGSSASPPTAEPWLVFCSPPYALFYEKQVEMLELIARIQEGAPAGSILLVEADESFDFELVERHELDEGASWDIRHYAPAVVGVWRC